MSLWLNAVDVGEPIKNLLVHGNNVFVVLDKMIVCLNASTLSENFIIKTQLTDYVCVNDYGVYSVGGNAIYRWRNTDGTPLPKLVITSITINLNITGVSSISTEQIVIYTTNNVTLLYNCKTNLIKSKRSTENIVAMYTFGGNNPILVTEMGVYKGKTEIYKGDVYPGTYFDHTTNNLFLRIRPDKYRRMDLSLETVQYFDYNVQMNYKAFYPYDGYIFVGSSKVRKVDYKGVVMNIYRTPVMEEIKVICAKGKEVFAATESRLYRYDSRIQEEDSNDYIQTYFKQPNLPNADVANCKNSSLLTLSDYTRDENPVQLYLQDSKGNFTEAAHCFTLDELKAHLEADLTNPHPLNVMSICTRSTDTDTDNNSGFGAKPTHKIVVKLPVQNVYVTLGSLFDIIQWGGGPVYAFRLFGGKRRRITNVKGIYGVSMNHCQTPGLYVYKVYKRDAVLEGAFIGDDLFDFLHESVKSVFDANGGVMTDEMIRTLLSEIIKIFDEI
ncbi:hypothetical protein EB118_08985 [bacterium]|nr:hypothetical protein [bacterium]NDC94462.1 hypothetical protein [bacterium]NDD84435.1 hypothetical protein [bacterium]NDG30195.1 hypothetical protein [bacterium]